MSDMRLVVAGAGGRMGRTLIHAIAATDGVILAGAVEAASSAVIGRDAGELAGLGKNGVVVAREVEPLLAQADGLVDFTVPAATIAFAQLSVDGRNGTTAACGAGDIGFASLRGCSVVGDHSVLFAGPAERIELSHKAEDRMIFARGALRAALWARGRRPGLYSMADVLGLSDV